MNYLPGKRGYIEMRKNILLTLCMALSACAYNYNLGVDPALPKSQSSSITFDNRVKVSRIDGKDFSRMSSMWVHGSHTINMSPGYHTFQLRYDGRSLNGGIYTKDDVVISGVLEKGKSYILESKIEGNQILFYVIEDLTSI